ncbi:MAG: undecaprenyldiphospho-muramoylpentapeptide beta-N-acetylglucosaminyltransferase [Spirochaetota bacterium]
MVLFTGGGTGGHVYPGLAVVDDVRRLVDAEVAWIGDSRGVERAIVEAHDVRFLGIPTGKLRRYLSLRNVTDVFRVIAGVLKSLIVVARERPVVLFSKGGFVSVPPVFAARLLGVPVISHESDADPGLATRINARSSREILVAYDATRRHFGGDDRVTVTGNPLRGEIFRGVPERGLDFAGFDRTDDRPVVLFLGGSLGARQINELARELRPRLAAGWRIIHQTGSAWESGQADALSAGSYFAAPFFGAELPDLLAAADVLVCRAGASTLWEAAALEKPMLLVPLGAGSRGDQVRNAAIFEGAGGAMSFTHPDRLVEDVGGALARLGQDVGLREEMGRRARSVITTDATERIARIVVSYCERA